MAVGSHHEPQEQLPVTRQSTQQPVSPWTDAAAFWLLGLLNNSGADEHWRPCNRLYNLVSAILQCKLSGITRRFFDVVLQHT